MEVNAFCLNLHLTSLARHLYLSWGCKSYAHYQLMYSCLTFLLSRRSVKRYEPTGRGSEQGQPLELGAAVAHKQLAIWPDFSWVSIKGLICSRDPSPRINGDDLSTGHFISVSSRRARTLTCPPRDLTLNKSDWILGSGNSNAALCSG